jgi:hypothetical protein
VGPPPDAWYRCSDLAVLTHTGFCSRLYGTRYRTFNNLFAYTS